MSLSSTLFASLWTGAAGGIKMNDLLITVDGISTGDPNWQRWRQKYASREGAKVAVDLLTSERRKDNPNVAVVRVEQLYPFPDEAIRAVIDRYSKVREICWVQEEPENMGAWEFVRPLLEELLGGRRIALRYVGRTRAASPSEGSTAWHQLTQKALIEQVLDPADEPVGDPLVLSKRV